MLLKIYSIYDKDSENLNERTFNATNEKVAKRMLKETLRNDKVLAHNAEHYELHECGTFDTENGISGNGHSKKVCELSELLGMPEQAEPATPTAQASAE